MNNGVSMSLTGSAGSGEGYVLQSIQMLIDALPSIGGTLTVTVREANASGNPSGTILCTLDAPNSYSVGTITLSVANNCGTVQLDKNTTYFVHASFSTNLGGSSIRWETTTSNSEDADGYNGWTIANNARYYANGGWQIRSNAMQIRVKGKSKPTVADETVTIGEDTGHTFEAANFNFSDTDGDTLRKVRITDLPGKGTLSLDDAAIDSVPTQITKAEFDAQEFKYTPAPDGSEAGKLDVAGNVTGVDEASTADPADVTVIA